jgi:hypothetical protein
MLINPSQVRVLGPLSAFATGFAHELAYRGYTLHSARNQMLLMAHLSRWLLGEGLGATDLHTGEVERFLRVRRAAGYAQLLSIKAMRPILAYLRNLGVVPTPPPPTPGTPVEEALERYRIYLTVERGLRRKTGHAYVDAVRPFLQGRIVPSGVVLDLRHLAAAEERRSRKKHAASPVATPYGQNIHRGAFQPLTGNTEPMTDETSGPFRLLSGRGDAPVGYGAGAVSARRTGAGGMEGGWNFSPPCSSLRPKKRSNSH